MKKKLIVISSLATLTLASTIMLSNVDTLLTKADAFNGELSVIKRGKRFWYVCNFN